LSATTRRDLRWNFSAAFIDTVGWIFGMGLVSQTTILPLFVGQLTSEPLIIGLIPVATYFGWLVPGILVSHLVERLPRVRGSVFAVAMLERVMLLLMALLCFWLGSRQPAALLWGFFACWLVMNTAMGVNIPGYYKLIAKTIPADLRGRLYGIGGAASGVLGLAAAPIAAWFIATHSFPHGFALCFLGAFVAHTLSVIPLGLMREPRQEPGEEHRRTGILGSLGLLREDRRILWLGVATCFYGLNQMAAGYFALYSQQKFHASPELIAGAFTATVMAAKTVAFVVVGWIGDRIGNRAALDLAAVSGLLASAVAWLSPWPMGMFLVFALNEVVVQGWSICSMNYVLELCPPERASRYTAVYHLVSAPFRILPPILGGLIVRSAGYAPLFALSALAAALGLAVLRLRVPEVRE